MAYNVYHSEISNKLSCKFLVQKLEWFPPGYRYMNHVKKGGGGRVECFFVCVCAEENRRVKNCLGECSLKVTRPDGGCSKILVSNPVTTGDLPLRLIARYSAGLVPSCVLSVCVTVQQQVPRTIPFVCPP